MAIAAAPATRKWYKASFERNVGGARNSCVRPHLPGHVYRQVIEHTPVYQQAVAQPQRSKDARKRDSRPDRFHNRPLLQHNFLTLNQVYSYHSQRYPQIGKRGGPEQLSQVFLHALPRKQAGAWYPPVYQGSKVAQSSHSERFLFHLLRCESRCIPRGNQPTHASAGQHVKGNTFTFEDFQHTNMSQASGPSTTQYQPNLGAFGNMDHFFFLLPFRGMTTPPRGEPRKSKPLHIQ